MAPRRYKILDVFSRVPLAGNPLAVVLDSAGLSPATMQAIAREFNLSETVFVLPPVKATHSAAVRIFTPAYELPFAGHPTVGTAIALSMEAGRLDSHDFVLEAPAGLISCTTRCDGGDWHARFRSPKLPAACPLPGMPQQVAAALGLAPEDLIAGPHAPSAFGAGNAGFAFVPLRDLDALARAQQMAPAWAMAFGSLIGAFLYTSQTADAALAVRARMLDLVIGEDPATGSAVAAFAGVLVKQGGNPDGVHKMLVGQGYEMGRPSQIELAMTVEGGQLTAVHISGHAVQVAEGRLLA